MTKRIAMALSTLVGTLTLAMGSLAGATSPPVTTISALQQASGTPPGLVGAPAGSCAASPTNTNCPTTHAIVTPDGTAITANGTYRVSGYSTSATGDETGYGPLTKDGNTCHVRTDYPDRTPDMFVVSHGHNRCYAGFGVTYSELYETLYVQRGPGTWDLKKQNSGWSYFGADVDVTTSVKCGNNNRNWWGARAFAASVVRGVTYTGSNPNGNGRKEANLACGGTYP